MGYRGGGREEKCDFREKNASYLILKGSSASVLGGGGGGEWVWGRGAFKKGD